MPAARPPHRGPSKSPDNKTKPSPGCIYPSVGVGILIIIVPMQVKEANKAAVIVSFMLSEWVAFLVIEVSVITNIPPASKIDYVKKALF